MKKVQATSNGGLYIVSTPIGHLEDISLRAIATLKSVDLILAEDTRHSQQLLTALGISNQLSSFHAHNEKEKCEQIMELLLQGKSIALISDAGTPLIADPGFPLVKLAAHHDIPVIPIPGPCALIAALSASGLPCDSFIFIGFLPAKQQARQSKLSSLKNVEHTLVFYESTHRICACLDDLIEIYGQDCGLVLAKELTKTFERFVHGTAVEVKRWLLADPGHIKGEFVLIIPPRPLVTGLNEHEALLKVLLQELPLKQAVSIACKLTQVSKNELYDTALKIKETGVGC
ncbi:MAG: 16S rRNA (cytidine(1402)-2'-O)-methyltransferase [Legionella sp.]|nr:16S rRNA (cytidine(1402)-2'-O)-methyltransferase [Legionella sp.]